MANSEKIEIDKKDNININDNNYIDDKKEQVYKLDFNFDILNDPMPDFITQKKNDHFFLNIKNYAYKRKYNEIQNNDYPFPGKPCLKLK